MTEVGNDSITTGPKEGSRHTAFLALAGILCRAGWSNERIRAFHSAVYRAADLDACAKELESTAQKRKSGADTTGYPALAKLMNPAVLKTVLQWICIEPGVSSPSHHGGIFPDLGVAVIAPRAA